MTRFNLDGYFPSLTHLGLDHHGATEEEIAAVAARELADLDANEPGHDVELWELERFLRQWCA